MIQTSYAIKNQSLLQPVYYDASFEWKSLAIVVNIGSFCGWHRINLCAVPQRPRPPTAFKAAMTHANPGLCHLPNFKVEYFSTQQSLLLRPRFCCQNLAFQWTFGGLWSVNPTPPEAQALPSRQGPRNPRLRTIWQAEEGLDYDSFWAQISWFSESIHAKNESRESGLETAVDEFGSLE